MLAYLQACTHMAFMHAMPAPPCMHASTCVKTCLVFSHLRMHHFDTCAKACLVFSHVRVHHFDTCTYLPHHQPGPREHRVVRANWEGRVLRTCMASQGTCLCLGHCGCSLPSTSWVDRSNSPLGGLSHFHSIASCLAPQGSYVPLGHICTSAAYFALGSECYIPPWASSGPQLPTLPQTVNASAEPGVALLGSGQNAQARGHSARFPGTWDISVTFFSATSGASFLCLVAVHV